MPASASLDLHAAEFKAFQWDYLAVYWTMQFADWLQGPYIYALYGARGFTQGQVSGAGHSVSPGSGWACL